MSDARKIWANVDLYDTFSGKGICGEWNHCDVGSAADTVYHHDDVVRELVEALERVSENMAKMATGQTSLIDSTKRTADVALAKIAQEG